MTKLILLFVGAVAANAQILSLGAKVGSPINDPGVYTNSPFGTFSQGRWTGGPTVELHLPANFSIEFDALYRSSQSTTHSILNFGATNPLQTDSSTNMKGADLPLLLKYRFRFWGVRPFLSAGYQWSYENRSSQILASCLGSAGSCTPPGANFGPGYGSAESSLWRNGPAAGAGVEFKVKALAISPEVRYTHLTQPNTNQVTALVGFSFGIGHKR
jgi:hypothetical protein